MNCVLSLISYILANLFGIVSPTSQLHILYIHMSNIVMIFKNF